LIRALVVAQEMAEEIRLLKLQLAESEQRLRDTEQEAAQLERGYLKMQARCNRTTVDHG